MPQDRQLYRIFTNITPQYCAHLNEEGEELRRLTARIMDISGGGMQLRVKEPVAIGTLIRSVFTVDGDADALEVTTRALSVEEEERSGQRRVHSQFVDVPRAVQERVVRFVFRTQIAQQKRQAQ